jgi:hypothetical protein
MSLAVKDKSVVLLSREPRQPWEQRARSGTPAARALAHARILGMAAASGAGGGESEEGIAAAVGVPARTVARVHQRFVRSGREAALHRQPPTGRQYRKLDGAQQPHLIAVACSPPPAGHDRWNLRLLAERLVEWEVVDAIDPSTVYRTLKKPTSSRG